MGEILVAYDESELAKKALNRAIQLMKEGDELIILYVIPTPLLKEFADLEPDQTLAKGRELVNKEVTELQKRKIKAIGVVRQGSIAEEILRFSKELDCDMIIMGSRGKGHEKVSPFVLGSVTETVIRNSACPVLIVK